MPNEKCCLSPAEYVRSRVRYYPRRNTSHEGRFRLYPSGLRDRQRMETLNLILGIVASVASIIAAVISLSVKSDVKKMRDAFRDNTMSASGTGNSQVIGSDNKANVHATW